MKNQKIINSRKVHYVFISGITMKIIILFLSCSLLSFSQNAYVRTFNTDFFNVFGGGQLRKTVSNGKDLVTWNIQTLPGDLPKIALMDSAMHVQWCYQYQVLNFVNSGFHIENITFDENNNLLVCGNATMGTEPCSIILRLNRSSGSLMWNTVVDSVQAVTAYGVNKHVYFFGNKNKPGSISSYMSEIDSTGFVNSFQILNFSDSLNGQYRISDAVKFNKTQHLVYFSPVSENKNNNRCKLLCVGDFMNIIWTRGYKELGHAPVNNRSLIAVNDTEFIVNNFERDSTLFKFNKSGQLIWGKKFNTGGAATPYVITGNLLLLSRPENGGSEVLINESTGACVTVNSNRLCEPLTGNYSNRLIYYYNTGVYQLCSAANYFSITNGCAGSSLQLPLSNFNAVALHHNYAYSGCAFQSEGLPVSSSFTLTTANATEGFPLDAFASFFCNTFSINAIPINMVYVEEGCGLSLGLEQQKLAEDQFSVFPNPATAKITIEANITSQFNAELFDLDGKRVYSKSASDKTDIDIKNCEEGIYTLVLKIDQQLITKKIAVIRQ